MTRKVCKIYRRVWKNF